MDGVQIVYVTDDLTRELTLRGGEIDEAVSLITTNFAKLRGDGFVVLTRPTSGAGQALIPDSGNPKSPFADIRVRQAAAYAIDNPTLVKAVFGEGGAIATNQPSWPGYWAYNPSVVGYPYNPAKAKQLLTAAGYSNGFQTRLVSPNDTQRLSYATGVQGYLKAVGVNVTIDVLTSSQILEYWSGKSWEGLSAAQFGLDPDWVSQVSSRMNGQGSYVSMLVSDDYSQAINNAVIAPDFATEQKFAQEAMKLMIDKYALMIPEYTMVESEVLWPYVHDTGLNETNILVWRPEAAWMSKK